MTLALNGIAATQEMHSLKEKALRQARLEEGTSIVCKYGPIHVSNARLCVVRDEYNRQAAQEEEKRRLVKRDAQDEVVYIRRWFKEIRALIRRSVRDVKIKEIFSFKKKHSRPLLQFKNQADWWCKADYRVYLDSAVMLSQRYALYRELQE